MCVCVSETCSSQRPTGNTTGADADGSPVPASGRALTREFERVWLICETLASLVDSTAVAVVNVSTVDDDYGDGGDDDGCVAFWHENGRIPHRSARQAPDCGGVSSDCWRLSMTRQQVSDGCRRNRRIDY